jgi:hypothetical protein
MTRRSSPAPRRRLSARPSPKVIREFGDRGTLWLLEDPANLHDLLQIVEPSLAEQLDFSRAERVPRTFIPADLRKRESDLIVSVPFRGEAAGEVWVYLLLEHQSTPDRWMGLRLFLYMYMAQIWDRQWREWEDGNVPEEERRLRPIVPLLFYTGEERWAAPLDLASLMRLPAELEAFAPRWRTLRLDLHETPPETLTRFASAVGWALRALQAESAPSAEMEQVLSEAMAGLEGLTEEQAGQWQRAAWYLMLLVMNRREEEALAELLVERARRSKFRQRGEVVAMGKSILEQVEARGEESGIRQALVMVLVRRFGALPPEVEAALERADVTTMSAWLATAATATSLAEVGIVPAGPRPEGASG